MNALRSRVVVDGALLALLAATALVVATGLQPVRPFVVLASACLIPGAAILTRLGPTESITAVPLAVALSLAVETGFALLLVWTGWWQPALLGVGLATASAALLLDDLIRARRSLAVAADRGDR